MGRTTRRYALFVAVGGLLGACGDDLVIPPDTESGTGTSTGSTTDPPTPTSTVPTTTESPTTDDTSLTPTTDPTTDPTTTSPITSSTGTTTTGTDTDTSTGTGTTDTSTGTGTDTDTDTGNAPVGRSVSQTVNGGTVATSPGFLMVFTLGQPTQNQGTTTSPGFKLQGGLIGANGNPP